MNVKSWRQIQRRAIQFLLVDQQIWQLPGKWQRKLFSKEPENWTKKKHMLAHFFLRIGQFLSKKKHYMLAHFF